jgi:hypothetical protein
VVRGQAEYLFALALAIIILMTVAVMINYFSMYSLSYRKVLSSAREFYQLTLSSLSGCIKNGSIYIVSTAPLDIFNALISNGTHILWVARSGSRLTATHIPPNTCVLVYNGSLADQVAENRAWVALVTMQGLIKWQPQPGEPCEFGPGTCLALFTG